MVRYSIAIDWVNIAALRPPFLICAYARFFSLYADPKLLKQAFFAKIGKNRPYGTEVQIS